LNLKKQKINMSVKTVNNPQTRKFYLDKIIEVLEHPLTLQISFAAYGVNITHQTFLEVANDLRAGFTEKNPPTAHINTGKDVVRYLKRAAVPANRTFVVLKKSAKSNWGEYAPSVNMFRFNLENSPQSPVWAVTVIHEAVHAWLDMKRTAKVDFTEFEALSYIAEHIYGIYTGISFAVQVDPEKRDIHTTARLIARTITIGKIPPSEWCDELTNHIRDFYGIERNEVLSNMNLNG
jgi:hypothetical protein